MNLLKKINLLICISLIGVLLVSCSKKNESPKFIKEQTPKEFVELLLTETNSEKYVHYIKYDDNVYDEKGNIKDEKFDECLEYSEKVRMVFKEIYEAGGFSIEEPYSINVDGIGEFKVVSLTGGGETLDLYLYPKNNTYQLFFSSSIGLNDYTFMGYKSGNEFNEPTKFRVVAELDDYFNYSFRDKELEYYSIYLSEPPLVGSESLHGYIKKDSEVGKEIFEILKDGRPHNIIVEIYVPNTEKPSNSNVVIKNLISDSWVYPKN